MLAQFSAPLDPGVAILLGALVGAGASVVVQIIGAIVAGKREARTFRRTLQKDNIASVTDAYEYALNVIFNLQRGGNPDRGTRGNVFAQISLRGSSQVVEQVQAFLKASPSDRTTGDLERMIKSMQEHLAHLAREVD